MSKASSSILYMDHQNSLKNVAQQGDINKFYNLIQENTYLLDDIDALPFVDTPLHVAASHGKVQFAMEIISLKPSFVRKLNHDGFSPIHLALFNRQTDMVLRLLDYETDLVRLRGREGKTIFHYVAENGVDHAHQEEKLSLLAKFLLACPLSIRDVTNRRETALHIAVKNRNFHALCLLLGGLQRSLILNSHEIRNLINFKDGEGNSVLHIATATNQPQVVKLLLKNKIDVNAKNSNCLTALDMLHPHNREVRESLLHVGALSSKSLPQVAEYDDNLRSNITFKEHVSIFCRSFRKDTISSNLLLMLVAVILITAATSYQIAVSSLGGTWHDNNNVHLRYGFFIYNMANFLKLYLMILLIFLLVLV
ncbi:ankyrin repeat-containing protein BDA1 [Ziziphus jujuba]|uniref:Ankyrin repeat-containing protein BDA1 n=1 Tax=Ziziphus jujuba TaxID=326968 RepID=A0A6P4AT62_ZIZJJ|nr:ankyrin repeat-containing protein BDA1 [Ziziphus jujuba]